MNAYIASIPFLNGGTDTLLIVDDNQTSITKEIDVLIIMIDNRFKLLNNNNKKKDINMTYLTSSYFYYSFCINYLYSHHYNYSLLLIDPLTNDSSNACISRYYNIKNKLVPMEWCKLEILSYYLEYYNDINYKWLLYLDADTHIIRFNFSFNKWLTYINNKYINNIHNIYFMITNDTPRFIERELPRLQGIMDRESIDKDYNCNTYGNAGVLLFKRNNITISMINDWSKSINQIPERLIRVFPREQGALNCFITNKYSKYIHLFPSFTEINIDWFYRDISFIQHITSANWYYRTDRFKSFLNQLIESNNGNYSSECNYYKTCLPSFKDIKLNIDNITDSNNLLFKCVNIKHPTIVRKFGNMQFTEHRFY